MPAWITDNSTLFIILTGASVLMFLASLALAPFIATQIPADYFTHDRRPASWLSRRHPALRLTLLILKNLAGVILLAAGLAMLFLPGQGLLTLFVGFLLLNFPGKYRAERWLVSRRVVRRPINWLRNRRHREPLATPKPNPS